MNKAVFPSLFDASHGGQSSIRGITGKNRQGEGEDIIAEKRLSQDAYDTIQQIYNNIASQFSVSEIYAVIDGLDYKEGEIPFFMFDELIFQNAAKKSGTEEKETADTPEEAEEKEYEYFPQTNSAVAFQPPEIRIRLN